MVATIDGKAATKKRNVGPFGGKADREGMVYLRSYADGIVHGRVTSKEWHRNKTYNTPLLIRLRSKRRLPKYPHAFIFSQRGKSVSNDLVLRSSNVPKPVLVVPRVVRIAPRIEKKVDLFRIEKSTTTLKRTVGLLAKRYKLRRLLIEGGPELNAAFIAENLIDDLFLTINPKIIGGKAVKTLVEGRLFPEKQFRHLRLLKHWNVGDELFLQYRFATSPYAK